MKEATPAMRFSCQTSALLSALSLSHRALSARTTQPIYEGILVKAVEGQLHFTGSDGQITIVANAPATVSEEGSVILPGRLFHDVVRRMPDGELTASLNEKFALTLRCQGSRTTIAGQNPALYPSLPKVELEESFSLPQTLIKTMIQQTGFAISSDETRPVLTGSLLELNHGEVRMVALDGFRLALRLARADSSDRQLNAIIPARSLQEIAKIMSDDEQDLSEISVSKGQMKVAVNGAVLYSTLIEGEFIRYRQIIPTEFATKVSIQTRTFAQCIERAALMAKEGKNNLVKFAIDNAQIVITSNSESGDVYEELDADIDGAPLSIAFNVRYMQEVLRAIGEDNMTLNFNSPVSPALLRPQSGDAFTYLILPVRVTV